MGSQSFCTDPYPLPSSFKTNSPWLPLTPPPVLQLDAPCSLLVWPLVDSSLQEPNLSCLLLSLFLTTGASSEHRSWYESTPPSGRLVSDPPLPTGRNVLLFPLSRNCTQESDELQSMQVKDDSIISVQSLSYGLSDLQFSNIDWILVCSSRSFTWYTLSTECCCIQVKCLVSQFASLSPT